MEKDLLCRLEHWSVRQLRKKIDGMLYERTAISHKPENVIFIARQKRITIDNEDFYIDLLTYHRGLKRLVAIELKLGKFTASHKGQMELYLRWLNKYERRNGEEEPLGLILCAEKKQEHIELLELGKSGIHVAQYLTQLPPREILEEKLKRAIEIAQEKQERARLYAA